MRTLPILLLLAACGSSTPGDDSAPAVTDDPRFDASTWPDTLGTNKRPAPVVAPSNYDGKSELPVVLMLHGYGVSGVVQDFVFGFSNRVDEHQFVLILPDGTEDAGGTPFWNATKECCNFYGSDVDDVGYLTGLLDEAAERFPVNPDKVTVVGHSNGGYMSYRLACEIPDRLAGIAPLAGNTFSNASDCKVGDPVSVLHMHGTVDDTIFYGPSAMGPGAEASLERWRDRAGCTDAGTPGDAQDYVTNIDGAETDVTRWSEGCSDNTVFELWAHNETNHIPAFSDAYRDDLLAWMLARTR